MVRKRNDSTGSVDRGVRSNAKPVEQYRRQIAKNDTKKSKENLKETKFKATKKRNAPAVYKDVAIMVSALFVVAICVYLVMYVLLSETAALQEGYDENDPLPKQ